MQDRQSTFVAADISAQLGYIDPRSVGVQHQQVDIGQEDAELLGRPAVVSLEHGVSAHAQQARNRQQQRVVITNDDATPLKRGIRALGHHVGLRSGEDGRLWQGSYWGAPEPTLSYL